MDQHLIQFTQIRTALLGSAGPQVCCEVTGSLQCIMTGDVFNTAPHHFEATGPCVMVAATCLGNQDQEAHTIDNITWHVVPETGGVFQQGDAGVHFNAQGPGTYTIWASASPKIESPHATLVVPEAADMRSSPCATGSCRGSDAYLNQPADPLTNPESK